MIRPNFFTVSRGFAFALGGVVAILVLAVAAAILLFDADAVKYEASRLVLAEKQRTLRIDGELSLSFWPSVGLRLSKASLSERNSEQVFAAVDKARLSLKLLPLLKRELVVDTVELEGLSAQLIHRKDGTFNFEDLLSQEKDKPPLRFEVAGVSLAHGRVAWVDEAQDRRFELSEADLNVGRLANVAEGKLTLSGRVVLNKPALVSKLGLLGHYRYDLDKKTYALDGLDVRFSGDVDGLKDVETRLGIDVLSLAPTGLEASKLAISAKTKSGEEGLDLKLSLPLLRMVGDRVTVDTGSASATFSGSRRHGSATLNFTALERNARLLKAAQLALNADIRLGEDVYKARLDSPLSADLGSESLNLPKLSGDLEIGNGTLAVKNIVLPLAGNLQLDLNKSNLSTVINTRLDDGKLALRLDLSRFSPPAIGFALDIERLDVDKYLPPKKETSRDAAPKPVDFAFLNGLDLTGSLKVGALQLAGVKLANVRLDMRARDGKLEASPLAANLYQGSLAGSLSLSAKGNQVALKQTLSGVAINPLLKDALQKDFIEGRGNLSLDLTTQGASVAEMTKMLAGTARLDMKDGALKGFNLAKSLKDLKGRLIARQDVEQGGQATDKTEFTEFAAGFKFTAGVAHNEDLNLKSPFLRVNGGGDVDLPKQSLDYGVKVAVVPTATGQTGKDLADLKGLVIPLRVSGPFEKPRFRLEFASILSGILQSKVQEAATGAIPGEVTKQLDGVLKGLLGK